MKTTFLLAVASFGIFALSGCGSAGNNTNTAATNTGQKTNATATKTGNILKPGDVSPDKAIKVSDLVDSVASDKDAWKGKEVAVKPPACNDDR